MSRVSTVSYSVENRLWQNYLKDNTVSKEEEEMQFLMLVPLRVEPPKSPHQCVLCRKEYQIATSLKLHKRTHTGYKPFSCTICKSGFQTTTKARVHILKHLDSAKPVEEWCSLMEKLPIDQSVEEELIKSEVGPSALSSFTCILCKTPFGNGNMMEHYRIHIGLRPYKCLLCHSGFSSESTIKLHCENHLHEKKNEKTEENVGNGSDARFPSYSSSGKHPTPLLSSLLESHVAPSSEILSMRSVSVQSGTSFGKQIETDMLNDTKLQSHFSPLTPVSNQTICDVEELDSEIKADVVILSPEHPLKRSIAAISQSDTVSAPKRKHKYPIKPPPLPNRQKIEKKAVISNEPPNQNSQRTTQRQTDLPCTFPGMMGMQPMVFLPSCSNGQNAQSTSTACNSPGYLADQIQPVVFLPTPPDFATNQPFIMQMSPAMAQLRPGCFQSLNSNMGYSNSGVWNGRFYPNMGSFHQISPHASPHALNNQPSGLSARR